MTTPEKASQPEVNWHRTISRTEMLKQMNSRLYEEPAEASKRGRDIEGRPAKYGWYKDRHVIGRDERVNGGIYLGSGGREEIVVDDQKNPEVYQGAYDVLWEKIRARMADQQQKGERSDIKNGVLSDVFDAVRSSLEYDDEFANTVAETYTDRKVDLGSFLLEGKGVCRHQALLAAYLLERLGREGYISGQASVDRNAVPGLGAHAWTRYTNSAGEVFIIDPAQEYIGRLADAPREGWQYHRPGES